jgi:hypothetical protein
VTPPVTAAIVASRADGTIEFFIPLEKQALP